MSRQPDDVDREGSESDGPLARLGSVALSLWLQGAAHDLGRVFARAQIPLMLLKGPDLQYRLYGTPAAYTSGDIDVLVRRDDGDRARRLLHASGWEFEPSNGFLWRLSAAATYQREGVSLDLHWGLHAAHLPAWSLRSLESALWEGARIGTSGMYEPRPEALVVYLAVHAAGHDFERPQWRRNAVRAAGLVEDWPRVWEIARAARVEATVRNTLDTSSDPPRAPLLDGAIGRAIWFGTWVARGHFVPPALRGRLREEFRLRRSGFGSSRGSTTVFGGLPLDVPSGVFPPRSVTEEVLELALELVAGDPSPVLVDVGTGCGAVALAFASRRPDARVVGIDISHRAIACARDNAKRLGLTDVRFAHGSLLDPIPPGWRGRVTVMTTNLPYVPAAYARTVEWDAPLSAIEGPGIDGLDMMRDLAGQARDVLARDGWLVCQVGDWQWSPWSEELVSMGFGAIVPPAERRPGRAVVGAVRNLEAQG